MKRKLLLIIASLLVSGVMCAQDYYWSEFNFNQWSSYQTVYGKAYLNGELQNRGDIEVAAFVNGELRGREFLILPWPDHPEAGYYIWTPCYSDVAGEVFTYKAYDHASGILYDLCDTELTSSGTQGSFGSTTNPLELRFTKTEEPEEPTYGPEYPWIPSTLYNGDGMLVTAQIRINGENVTSANYEVGAFCGEECRGNSNGGTGTLLDDWTDDDLGYFAFMNVMGNNGDLIDFYLYDLEDQSICPVKCFTTVTLENGGELGIDIMGGDIFVLNFVTERVFEKPIQAYEDERDHYYLIATPIGEVSPENVENMTDNNYDLYYFDQQGDGEGNEWINIHVGTNLVTGKGYLYANSGNVTLKFKGFPYDGNGDVILVKDKGDNSSTNLEGWNLVGNPFGQTAYIDRPFYKMNDEGYDYLANGGAIEAMEGIFVIANKDNDTLTFSKTQPTNGKSQIVLNVICNRGTVIDRAIVSIGEKHTLPKFMLNESNTKLYIPQDDMDYAVVNSSEAGEIPVSFKANQNGNYTIKVNTEELDVNYMHLIDNLTGADVDLLQNPSYNFNAQTTDYANRFKLVFATGVNNDDVFGFYSNGNWIINNDGDAVLQVIDVTGRIMSSEEIHGSCSKRIMAAPGVYMLRLVKGDDMKVQKIVVK